MRVSWKFLKCVKYVVGLFSFHAVTVNTDGRLTLEFQRFVSMNAIQCNVEGGAGM